MRRRLVLGVKSTQNRAAQRPKEKGPLARGRKCTNPSWSHRTSFLSLVLPLLSGRPPFFVRSLLLYIILFCSSSPDTCQSSMPILQCTSHRPFFLALCELLWPPSHCLGVTSTLVVSRCQLSVFNTEVTASTGVASPPCSYG